MNYLAHAYLSFGIPEITVGNLISDFVKGKKQLDYPPAIRQGITLHRAIDTFTDTHDVTRQAKVVFRADYGLYAGALVDVVYDHFLANDPSAFPPEPPEPRPPADPTDGASLRSFARDVYARIAPWQPLFPERFDRMFHYMQAQDWLYHYRYREGICNSFKGLARRAAYMPDPEPACRLFGEQYTELESCYRDFFPSLKAFAFTTLQNLQERL